MRCRLLLTVFVLSVCLSRDSTVCGAFMQPLPNYFGLLLTLYWVCCIDMSYTHQRYVKQRRDDDSEGWARACVGRNEVVWQRRITDVVHRWSWTARRRCWSFVVYTKSYDHQGDVYRVYDLHLIRLHWMHEMLSTVTDVRGACPSVCLWRGLNRRRQMQCRMRGVIQCSLHQMPLASLLLPFSQPRRHTLIRCLITAEWVSEDFQQVFSRTDRTVRVKPQWSVTYGLVE